MTVLDLEAHQHSRALLSVYYHGRRDEAPLKGHPPPAGVLSLARAVSLLASAHISAQRLALADLCRTRAKRPTPTVVAQMRNLAIAYERRTSETQKNTIAARYPASRTAFVVVGHLDAIFSQPIEPAQAYLKAIQIMVGHESPPPPDGTPTPILIDYSVSPQ